MYKTETLEKNVQDDTISITEMSSVDFGKLSQSIQTLYPTVESCYVGYVNGYSNDGLTQQDTILVLIQTSVKLPQTDYDRLNAWLKVQLDTDNFILLENFTSEETTTETTTETTQTTPNTSEISTTETTIE
jgi:hypothetical protein